MKRQIILLVSCSILLNSICFSQDSQPLTLEAGFTGDMVRNFKGGLEKGNTTLGLVNMILSFDTQKGGLWEGGLFFVNAHALLGHQSSADLIGDIQVASNIEGISHKFIYEAWYRQQLGDLSILAGLQNMNNDFFVSNYGGAYLNSSFGVGAFLSLNNYVSIYPNTTLGTMVRFDKETFSVLAGIYNHGTNFVEETSFEFNNHIFKQGFIVLGEAQFRPEGLNGEYKLGFSWRHCTDKSLLKNPIFMKKENYSFYALADQELFEVNKRKIGVFAQTGYSPFKSNISPLFLGGGINIKGLVSGKEGEELGLAIASARIHELNAILAEYNFLGNETAIELTYNIPLHSKINLHPDFQYIINPSGSNELENAFVGILRLEVDF